MTFITTLASVFFANYILSLIINALRVRNGRRWFIGIISVFELGTVGYYTYSLIHDIVILAKAGYSFSEYAASIISVASYIFAILAGYLVSLFLALRGVKVFKSKRQRDFDRENAGKASVSQLALDIVIISVGTVLTGVSFAILAVLGRNAYFWSFLSAGIVIIIFGIFITILGRKNPAKSNEPEKMTKVNDILFFVKTEDVFFTYIYHFNKETTLKEDIGRLGEEYNLSNFGELKLGEEKYTLVGITPNDFDYNLLKEITLEKDRRNYQEILSKVSKYQRVRITADTEMHVENVKNIK